MSASTSQGRRYTAYAAAKCGKRQPRWMVARCEKRRNRARSIQMKKSLDNACGAKGQTRLQVTVNTKSREENHTIIHNSLTEMSA